MTTTRELRAKVYADLRSWRQDGDEHTDELHEVLAYRLWMMHQSYWFSIASAGRYLSEQIYLWNLYQAGQFPNVVGDPYGPRILTLEGDTVISTANHVLGSDDKGRACDISVTSWLYHEHQFGLHRTVASELWHLSPFYAPGGPYLPGPYPPPGFRALHLKSMGDDVGALQHQLGIFVDNSFGPGTEAAVRAYQRRNGLTEDGVWGLACQDHYEKGPSVPVPVIPKSEDLVRQARTKINQAMQLLATAEVIVSDSKPDDAKIKRALEDLAAARLKVRRILEEGDGV